MNESIKMSSTRTKVSSVSRCPSTDELHSSYPFLPLRMMSERCRQSIKMSQRQKYCSYLILSFMTFVLFMNIIQVSCTVSPLDSYPSMLSKSSSSPAPSVSSVLLSHPPSSSSSFGSGNPVEMFATDQEKHTPHSLSSNVDVDDSPSSSPSRIKRNAQRGSLSGKHILLLILATTSSSSLTFRDPS